MRRYAIPPEVIAAAEAHNAKMMLTEIGKLPDHTGLDEPDKWKHGYVGEWGFEQLLLSMNIPYVKVNSVWASHDFIVYMQRYDVKTASKSWYKRLMVPKNQFSLNKDFYVGCRIIDYEYIEIHGVIPSAALGSRQTELFGTKGVQTYAEHLSKLQPIEEHFNVQKDSLFL